MAHEVNEGVEPLTTKTPSVSSLTSIVGSQEIEQGHCLATLQAKLAVIKTSIHASEQNAKDFEILQQRVKDTANLLTLLKSKVAVVPIPQLVHTLVSHQEGVGLDDHDGTLQSTSSKDAARTSNESSCLGIYRRGSLDRHDGCFIGEILKSIHMITDLVEVLVKMVVMAETEISIEKEKVTLGQEEIKKKVRQIESMSAKVEEMERFAVGTNCLLNEMQQKVEDMVLETSRQRQRAAENEQELSRVKQDFESLRSYVSSLISVREMILSSENHQTSEMQFERLVTLAAQLEGEKVKKETEVQKLMAENIRLTSMLDKKEAQLLAMNEQCKVMALNSYGA